MQKQEEFGEIFLSELLLSPKEEEWLEFKREYQIYASNGKLVEQKRDELIKDILGLANGNSHIIRKTKYIIIGVDDNEFDENGERIRHSISYRTPTQSEISIWLKDSCSPAVVGIKCVEVKFKDDKLCIISIPPTFNLHETTRDLNAQGKFPKFTVFMRQDEHIGPACVRDAITIQQLKQLHRQEIANPPAIWIGAISGGFVGLIISGAKLNEINLSMQYSNVIIRTLLTSLGIFFGLVIAYIISQVVETQYDWHYMTLKQRLMVSFLSIFLLILGIIILK